MKPSKVFLLAVLSCAVFSHTFAAMQVEKLNRGLIAVRTGQGYYLSWRLPANEPYNTGFNIYRGATLLNNSPITGTTNYTDAAAPQNSVYTVRAVVEGVEQEASENALIMTGAEGSSAGFLDINLQRPSTGAQGGTYSPGDGSVGDLDGDGIYEVIIKWDPNNAKDNSQSGVTDNVLIDAYKLDGARMWRIDLGPNIRAGAHYTQFLVYDFDGDGKAEIMMKTAEGTRQGTNSNAAGAYIKLGPAAAANHSAVHRNASGYILAGPEYLTVFDGQTGQELATDNYWPERNPVNGWGSNESYGNRVDRFNAAVAYVDGERPTAIFQRGYYGRMTFAAWNWRNGQLTRQWTFDSNTSGNSKFSGQGNHQLSVIDVNNDGKHDIVTGASVIGGDGVGLHTTGWGHGDALHVAHMIKGNLTPQIFMPHESGGHGVLLRHADNGTTIFNVPKDADVGRACAAELDPKVPGFKFWASGGMGLYDLAGKVVGSTPNNGNNSADSKVCNFVIWWDGDLAREVLDGDKIAKWDIQNNSGSRLLTAAAQSINGTKATPVVQADIFGDWREEVVWVSGNSAVRIYTTAIPTTHRLVTMMHDPVYRVAVSWQNSSYNQPPHPGYYIASDMSFPPPALNVAVIGGGVVNPPKPVWAYIGSGEIIDSLILLDFANDSAWSVKTDFNAGVKAYGDRNYLTVAVPEQLRGAEWISTSMETRRVLSPETVAQFKMKKSGVVYILHENRVTSKPAWIAENGFAELTAIVPPTVNDGGEDRVFTVYYKTAAAGDTVRLGVNSNDGASQSLMYLAAAVPEQAGHTVIEKQTPMKYALNVTRTGRGTFRINYIIKEKGNVRLELFDIKGSRIRTFVNTSKNSGAYHENFQAATLAAGMYLIKLRTGGAVLQERIMLAK